MSALPRRFSAGAVVVRRASSGWRYLLLRVYRTWDFPKGGLEPGETPLQGAMREVEEETGRPFAWNRKLSGKTLKQIPQPSTTIVVYDTAVHEKTRVVAYADGHVRAIPETQFAKLKKSGAVR